MMLKYIICTLLLIIAGLHILAVAKPHAIINKVILVLSLIEVALMLGFALTSHNNQLLWFGIAVCFIPSIISIRTKIPAVRYSIAGIYIALIGVYISVSSEIVDKVDEGYKFWIVKGTQTAFPRYTLGGEVYKDE